MRTINVIQTADGQMHLDERAAKHHVDKRIGDLLLPFAHRIIAAGTYKKITDLLDAEVETMRQIVALYDDLKMEGDE